MSHAQKPHFVFRRNGRVHLNRRCASVQSTAGSRGVRISGSNAGYTMFCGSVKGTGCPLHSPVSPSLPFPRVTVCHHISTGQGYFIGLFELIVGDFTTCHTQYTWDSCIFIVLFNRTTLQIFVTYLTFALYLHALWFYRFIQNDCWRFNNLSYTIHLR